MTADAREFWDARYAAPEYIFGEEPNVFLASQAQLFAPRMRVLDLACGEGRNSVFLAGLGAEVTGVDISPLAVDKARLLAARHGVAPRFEVADLLAWEFGEARYDAVVSIFIQFATPAERERIFGAIRATLRPGGWLVMQGYTPRQVQYRTGGPPSAEHMYTAAMLRESFAGFEFLHLREHEATLREGSKHVGRSALVDLVARKRAD